MGESIEYDRSAPEMVRSSQFPNKKHCPSPRKGGKPKQEKKQGQDKSYSAATSPPPDMQHLEAMNVPMTQTISPNIGSSLPPHHAMPSSGRDHHTSSPRNHRTPGIGGEGEKKTRGRVRIRMEFISNKLRRYTTFSKRKTGIMKKAYELSTLTGTQVMLLVASETGHVYTFATPKLQPMITSETGKALIQTCLNSPDPPPPNRNPDERMSQTGYEETELGYPVSTEEAEANKSERHMYPNSDPNMENSPTHSFPGLNMPHGSFPMNMAFIPATTKQGDSNNSNMSGPGYTVQQQLGNFGTIFPPPPPTTYSNSPQNMGNMTHMSGGGHMGRIPENMSPGHNIDIGNMVTLQRNPASTQSASADSPSPTYIYTSSPRSQPPEDTKLDIKQHENDNDTRDHGSPNSL